MIKVYLVLAGHFFAQFGAHHCDGWIDAKFTNGWNQMFKYMFGVLVSAPFFDALMWAFSIPEKTRRKMMLLFFATFFAGGLGTLLGWIVRPSPSHNGNGAH